MSDNVNDLIQQRDALNAQIEARARSAQGAHNEACWDIEHAVQDLARERGLIVTEKSRKNWTYLTLDGRAEVGVGLDERHSWGRPTEPVTVSVLTSDGGVQYIAVFSDIPPQEHLLGLLKAILEGGAA